MKIPKRIKRYCPFCRSHNEVIVTSAKKRAMNATVTMSRGSKGRTRARGERRGNGNHGKYSRGAITGWKRHNKKTSKKTDLRFECVTCKKKHSQRVGIRTKKLEIVS